MNPLLAVLDSIVFTIIANFTIIAVILIVFINAAAVVVHQGGNLRRVESKLRRVEGKLDALLQHHGIALPAKLSPQVQLLASVPGQKIAAIKLHREQTGLSLAEAKAEVEDFGH